MTSPRLRLDPLDPSDPRHIASLVEFLCGAAWPFHVQVRHTAESVAANVAVGAYLGPDNEGHWICEGATRVGLVVLQELEDPTPVFDLRLDEVTRGRGVGRAALGLIAREVFTRHDKHRFEGHTRADNLAMRRCFERSGWTQEAHYRQAWPDRSGAWHDATAYALLRSEWAGGEAISTPLRFPGRPRAQRLEELEAGA